MNLISRRPQTVQQLSKDLPEVASPTLYHHLNLLVKAGILEVVKTEQKRGTYEKTYALVQGNAVLSKDELAEATHEDLMRFFQVFVGGLIGILPSICSRRKIRTIAIWGCANCRFT
ncbi:hypothetical protein KDK_80120 [Dictyobacter kobayashii]|uniref:HTH arsR-type domain-containing protein n=1 Tax=Dictyobacter kobayashii TaxID=2014872 RepID=A0A402AYM5_9CHLR|nr:hypothetical protein KDK_80120 [Dictyobacter kobayashii]